MKKAKTAEAIKPSPDFGLDELIRALEVQGNGNPQGYFIVKELCDRLGHSNTWVRKHLVRLNTDGQLTLGYRITKTLDGRTVRVPAYRLKPPEVESVK